MTMERIDRESEKLNIESAVPPPNLMQLLAIWPIAKTFFQHIGVTERQILRGVSHGFADLVYNQNLQLVEFEIFAARKHAFLYLDNFPLKYRLTDILQYKGGRTVTTRTQLDEILVRDLKLLFKHKSTNINQFVIKHDWDDELPLPRTNLRLKVKKFRIHALNVTQVRSGLAIMDPKSIEEIQIELLNFNFVLSIDIVSHWKLQWKMAKVLVSEMRFVTNGFIQNFGHFDYLHFVVHDTRISLGVLEKLKETLLLRQTVQKFEIIPSFDHCPKDPLFIIPPKSFLPFQDPKNSEKFVFPYPNNKDVLTYEISYDRVFFKGPGYVGDKNVKKEMARPAFREHLAEDNSMYTEEPYFFNLRN